MLHVALKAISQLEAILFPTDSAQQTVHTNVANLMKKIGAAFKWLALWCR